MTTGVNRFFDRPTLVADSLSTVQALDNEGGPPASIIAALVPLLSGSKSIDEIFLELLVEGVDIASIIFTLNWLDAKGCLEESPDSAVQILSHGEKAHYATQIRALGAFVQSESNLLSPLPVAGVGAQAALKKAVVVVSGRGGIAEELLRLLSVAGVGTLIALPDSRNLEGQRRPGPTAAALSVELTRLARAEDLPAALREHEPSLLIYAPDHFDEDFCDWLNSISLRGSIPLLPHRADTLWIRSGPLVIPRETACTVCFRLRCEGARLPVTGSNDQRSAEAPMLNFPMGVDWLALDVVKFLTEIAEPVTRGRLLEIELLGGRMSLHPVLKLPRCPACGVHKTKPPRKLWEE